MTLEQAIDEAERYKQMYWDEHKKALALDESYHFLTALWVEASWLTGVIEVPHDMVTPTLDRLKHWIMRAEETGRGHAWQEWAWQWSEGDMSNLPRQASMDLQAVS